jgi:hypothetical protein
MASLQRSIPTIPTQSHSFSAPQDFPEVIEARKHLLSTLRGAARAVNAEIFRLETTGDLVDADIEKTYEALAWAVDAFREEQELACDEAKPLPSSGPAKRGPGRFDGSLHSRKGAGPCSWQ